MKHASYLKHLKFDPRLLNSLQARYLRNPRLLVLVLLVILGVGSYSYINLPRRLNPEVKIPIVIVSTVLPGAGPSEIETLVTEPLEDSIDGVDKLKTFTSTSQDSVSVISIEFNTGTDPDKAVSDVKSQVDSVTLPTDAQKPLVQKIDFERVPVWTFSLTSKRGDTASLISFSKDLRDRLNNLSTVDTVNVSGLEEQEIQIVLKPETLSTYSFNPQVLISAISSATKSFPAGSVRTDTSNFTLSVDPVVTNIDDLRNTKINLEGKVVNLSDIATISERSKPSQSQSYVAKAGEIARQAVSFSVFKSSTANINKAVSDSQKETDSFLAKYNNDFTLFSTSNVSQEIDDQFNELLRDFTITISLVFLSLLVFLGIRQALVASVSIPLTFLITFILMSMFGIALSFLSYFSLLLSLGLLVDDTIVVISAMTSYYRSGKFTPFETGLLVWKDFIVAIFTTTLTTVWAFVPLLLSSGIIGEFIKPIPIVVSSTLLGSFFVAMFITLPVIVYLLKPKFPKRVKILGVAAIVAILFLILFSISGKGPLLLPEIVIFSFILLMLYKLRDTVYQRIDKKIITPFGKYNKYLDEGFLSLEGFSIKYQGLIKKILSSKRWIRVSIAIVVIFFVFSFALVPLGFVKNEFFPKTDSNNVFVTVELPPGTNIQTSKKEALSIFRKLQKEKDIETVSLDLGQGISEFGGTQGSGSNSFVYTIVLTDKSKRKEASFDIAETIRQDFKNYTIGRFSVTEQSGGPPAGADVQIKLIGQDLGILDGYADRVQNYLKTQPGVTNVDKSIKPGTSKITFIPDRTQLSENGVSLDQIGLTLRTFASGFKLESVKFDENSKFEKDITLRFSSQSQFAESITELLITTQTGSQIPITALGKLELRSSPTLITREDGKRTISVTAGVKPGFSVSDTNAKLEKFAEE
jgi:multidrug efflux pump subunit AcrB